MSIFGKIKDAIFGEAKAASPKPGAGNVVPTASPGTKTHQTAPTEVSEVDVERNLAAMAEGKDLNWRTSIVDLMKLIGVDSSLDNRKELARELGYTGQLDGRFRPSFLTRIRAFQSIGLAARGMRGRLAFVFIVRLRRVPVPAACRSGKFLHLRNLR